MLCIYSVTDNPYFNLAAEEYLLRKSTDEIFMLWQSAPAIVSGKHQNTLSEINYRFACENHIPVARRLTGGGTVYHDGGNINFTFIRQGTAGKLVDFAGHINPVISFLQKAGISAVIGPKHEIAVNGRKISGNAEHVYKDRVLHHGTLLFESNLGIMRECLHRDGGTYIDKAVQSNRAHVANLNEYLNPPMQLDEFKTALFGYMLKRFKGKKYDLEEKQVSDIGKLADEKFSQWHWIFGWSPDYRFENTWRNERFEISIELNTHRGRINHCRVHSRQLPENVASKLNHGLEGAEHNEIYIRAALNESGIQSYLINVGEFEDLVFAFF